LSSTSATAHRLPSSKRTAATSSLVDAGQGDFIGLLLGAPMIWNSPVTLHHRHFFRPVATVADAGGIRSEKRCGRRLTHGAQTIRFIFASGI
jgi:hypothetical protein